MAEQIPFSIAEEILTKLGSFVAQEIGLARGDRKELEKLRGTLNIIQAALLNAEERQELVRMFKDVIYDADGLLDDFATYELRRGGIARQVSRFFSSSNQVAFHFRMGHRIKDIRGRLDGIANDIFKFNMISRATTSMREGNTGTGTHSFVVPSEIMGRDEDKRKIIEILLQSNNEENLSVVAIVGIGGLGKTTLAQLVYNDQEVLKHFDLMSWVSVSKDFDVKSLVKKIIGSVENLELEQLKNKLHEKLTQKRCLLVLDDVWNENFDKWDQLRILLKVGARGSKVLVTTRNSKVASTMGIDSPYVLKGLNEGQSWALFKRLAFGDDGQNAHPNLLQIGEEITKMCNGVPLVIKTLGRIEESQWVSVQKNKNLMLLGDGDNILKVLKLSYDNLPSNLKQCFTYCALFPKNYEINKKMLIQSWMAQGYIELLDKDKGLELEDVGDRYFKELLARSMFQEVNNRYKMHDLIYDMAQLIVKSKIFILANDVQTTIPQKIHHLSISGWSQEMTDLKEKSKSLRTLFASDYDDSYANSMVNTLVLNCKCLRVLDLGAGSKAIKLPKSVIKLGHLRYLSLSNGEFEVLPSGFTSLQNLQTLKLWRCEHLKELPRNIRKMINLRHLEIDGCRRLNYMPCRLGELTMLQTLHLAYLDAMEYMFENSSSTEPFFPSLKTLELDKLRNFKGWWREMAGEQAPSFPSLSQLLIRNCGQLTTVQLPSCPSLSTLEINQCGQLTTVQLPSCPSLSTLEINQCGQLTTVQLPSCPSLSRLEIYRCYQLTTVQLPSCPSLSRLKICGCGQLTTVQLPSCPFLSILKIYGCCQLTTVQLPSCSSLSTLKIDGCGQLTTLQLPSCPSLSTLKIVECGQLPTVQLLSSPHLSELVIVHCGSLESLELPSCSSLSELDIFDCNQLTTLKLPSCSSLSKLQIWSCNQLTTLELPSCPSLSTLEIDECDQLTTVQLISSPHLSKLVINKCESLESLQLPACPSLSELRIKRCYQLTVQQLPSCPELSELEIIRCYQLTTVQLLSSPHLSKLFIGYCENLKSLQLPSCPSLSTLEIDECDQLTTVQLISSPHLSKLVINNCESLESLQLPACPSLSELRIKCCYQLTVQQLPSCPELSELEIIGCYQLTTVQLLSSPHLSKLFIRYCKNLKSLQLPSCPSLSELQIECCYQLTTVQLLSSPRLSKLYIESCICLESLLLSSLPCLEELILGGLPKETLWRIILVSSSLKSLHISGRKSLLDDRLQHITSLKSLFQGIQHLGALEELRINHWNLSDKEDDDGGLQFQGLRSLRKLFITGIPKLVSLPKGLQHVTTLEIRSCDGLIMSQFQGIQHLGALEELRIYNCNLSDKEDDDGGLQFQGFRSLRKLFISEIPKLVSLPKGLQHVTTLETLSIADCHDFTTLPDWISSLTSLSELKIERCPRFKLEDSSKIAHIPTIHI